MFKRFAILLVALFAVSACHADQNAATAAPAARAWQSGVDYFPIDPPQPTSTGDKIEVVEVFSYACPHCAHFQPDVEALKARLPKNAQFVTIPAVFNAQWEPFARAFYTARTMGVLDKTHQALFDALHRDHLPLFSLDALANSFYAKYGVNPSTFISTANSFVVDSEMARGDQLVRAYGVSSTPTLVVNGKYRVEMNAERKIGPKEIVEIALYLVKQEETQARTAAHKKSL